MHVGGGINQLFNYLILFWQNLNFLNLLKWFLTFDQKGNYLTFGNWCVKLVQFTQKTVKFKKFIQKNTFYFHKLLSKFVIYSTSLAIEKSQNFNLFTTLRGTEFNIFALKSKSSSSVAIPLLGYLTKPVQSWHRTAFTNTNPTTSAHQIRFSLTLFFSLSLAV